MIDLILSILFSTSIVVLFKLYGRMDVSLFHTIVINYATCFALGMLIEPSMSSQLDLWNSRAFGTLITLGFFFIGGFTAIGLTVRYFGLGISALFQKLPFMASALFGIWYYHESSGTLKYLGLLLCAAAVVLSYKASQARGTEEHRWWHWTLPLLTFLAGAVIEVLLLVIKKEDLWSGTDMGLTTVIFGCAGVVGLLVAVLGSPQWGWPRKTELLCGIGLGIPNFFSIYFLLALLSHDWAGSVIFPINNIGILVLSGILGLFLFRENMTRRNLLGLLFAVIGILLILISS